MVMGEREQDTQQIKVKIPPEEIVFADMIFKSFEGLASLTVSNKKEGVIYLDVTRGTKSDTLKILEDLNQNQFSVEILKK